MRKYWKGYAVDNRISILSTAALAAPLIDRVSAADMGIDIVPFIQVNYLNDIPEIKECALRKMTAIFTSSNAVEAVARQIEGAEDLRIYCVGNSTAELIKKHFGDKLMGVADNAKGLAELILQNKEITEVTFFCGDMRRDELPELLKQNEIAVKEVVVYSTTLSPVRVKKEYDAILFFSPSAVESFFSSNTVRENTMFFAIGDTTGSALRAKTTNTIITGERPGKELLIDQVIAYYTKAKQRIA